MHRIFYLFAALIFVNPSQSAQNAIDLKTAVIFIAPGSTGPEKKAAVMLADEVNKRTQARWPMVEVWPADLRPIIIMGSKTNLGQLPLTAPSSQAGREGYRITSTATDGRNLIWIEGTDARGVLFGAGRLLRALSMGEGRVTYPAEFDITSAPQEPLRGHQLGYRPKCNSYDAWDVPTWEQYIRDLIVFGCNAIELIPPRSDDDSFSPHFPLPQMEMMVEMSRLCAEYGLDVWIWYPAMDKDYSKPETVEFALKEWANVFEKLPRIDAVFVPGGDPGHTQPKHLMALLEKQAASLQKFHPKAQMWVSPQSFNAAWMDEFFKIMQEEPKWLSGIVYGPQIRISLPELRAAVPARYPIRHYPDITHSLSCQYPVPDWDMAFALTEGREGINPRPLAMARIFRHTEAQTIGFLTYSEGCNDDVNKCVWSALGWNRETPVIEILREYSRYYIGAEKEEGFAQGLLALERNWEGPVLVNRGIDTTLQQFQEMERTATASEKLNWRFQQALYRAYYDAYTRARALHETASEERAVGLLRNAHEIGLTQAIAQADEILSKAASDLPAKDLRARIFELAEALFQSIRMQLSVQKYKGVSGRGNNLDTVDAPLNNRAWLKQEFGEILPLDNSAAQNRLDQIVNWTNPGPGGFYDDLGDPSNQAHLVRPFSWKDDPAFIQSPLVTFLNHARGAREIRSSWWNCATTLYETPLRMRYTDLDPQAAYKLKVVYGYYQNNKKARLVANGSIEIHDYLRSDLQPLEFNIPKTATSTGSLELSWCPEKGFGENGRFLHIAEVWLMKE